MNLSHHSLIIFSNQALSILKKVVYNADRKSNDQS